MAGKLILGIDPGSINVGYALIQSQRQQGAREQVQILKSGTLKMSSKTPFFERIQKIHLFFEDFCKDLEPFDVALESLIHVKNVSSLAKLAQARGVILASLSKNMADVAEYSPNLVKSTVSGYGFSSKQSVEKSLNFLFPTYSFQSHDESDALAIAMCHSFQYDKVHTQVQKKGRSLKEAFKSYNKKV